MNNCQLSFKLYDKGYDYIQVLNYIENKDINNCNNKDMKKVLKLLKSYGGNYCEKWDIAKHNNYQVDWFSEDINSIYTFKNFSKVDGKPYTLYIYIYDEFICSSLETSDRRRCFGELINPFIQFNYNRLDDIISSFLDGSFEIPDFLKIK